MLIEAENLVKNPLVSVVICTYNQEKYIAQTIESVLMQECDFDFEIIIGEDCGQDKTRDICLDYQKKFPEKIKLILHDENQGVLSNWYACINVSKGKYLAACAGDDYWHNYKKLAIQVDFFKNNYNCKLIHTDFNTLNVRTNELKKSINSKKNQIIQDGFVQKQIFDGNLKIAAPTVMFEKEFFLKYIPMEEFIKRKFPIEDWPTWVVLSNYGEFYYLKESTVTYRVDQESITNNINVNVIIERFRKEKKMYEYLCSIFPEKLNYDEESYDDYIHSIVLKKCIQLFDFKFAKKYIIENKVINKSKFKNPIYFYSISILKKIKK